MCECVVKQMNANLTDSLLYCSLFIASYITKKQYNKLSVKCAFVCSLHIQEKMRGTKFKI